MLVVCREKKLEAKRRGRKDDSDADSGSDGDHAEEDPFFKHDENAFDDPFFKASTLPLSPAVSPISGLAGKRVSPVGWITGCRGWGRGGCGS